MTALCATWISRGVLAVSGDLGVAHCRARAPSIRRAADRADRAGANLRKAEHPFDVKSNLIILPHGCGHGGRCRWAIRRGVQNDIAMRDRARHRRFGVAGKARGVERDDRSGRHRRCRDNRDAVQPLAALQAQQSDKPSRRRWKLSSSASPGSLATSPRRRASRRQASARKAARRDPSACLLSSIRRKRSA